MMNCTKSLLKTWELKEEAGNGSVELEVSNELCIITADHSTHSLQYNYKKGKPVFTQTDTLILSLSEAFNNPLSWIPGYRFTFLSSE